MEKRFTQEQLEEGFKLVQDKEHWKNPIDALIEPFQIEIVQESVIHFTATIPVFKKEGEKVRVKALGYRNGPAGDH